MKKLVMAVFLAVSMASPVLAMDHPHEADAEKCRKECQMLLKDCAREALSIQEQIARLQGEIAKGSDEYTVEELKKLNRKLQDINVTVKQLQMPR